jgi:hypothetical protein
MGMKTPGEDGLEKILLDKSLFAHKVVGSKHDK